MSNSMNNGRVLLRRRVWGTDIYQGLLDQMSKHLRAKPRSADFRVLQESDSRDGP